MAELFELEVKDDKPKDAIGKLLFRASMALAVFGVAVLALICVLSTISVLGRAIFATPIKGDVELVQIGCVLAIAAFLPYAQMKKAHIIVDFFTLKAPKVVRQGLDVLATLVLAVVALVLAWRSYFGAIDAYKNNTKTMILALPEWWAHLTITPSFLLLALTAIYTAWRFVLDYHKE